MWENFMTVRIVDRRFDSRNKSSVNRSRFLRRFKGQIRKAVSESVNRRKLRDLENGEKISIPGGDIAEPQFTYGKGGKRETVHPGNDRLTSGEEVDRPEDGGAGQGRGQASQDGEGLDDFVFNLSRDEFLDIFFDELALPNLVKKQLARIEQYRSIRAGYSNSGVPTNINLERTMRGATDNNPLKFLPDAEQAMDALFLRPRAGFLTGADGFDAALWDLRRHQSALFAALQPALLALLEDLDPSRIDAEAKGNQLIGNKKSKCWDDFVARWDAKTASENGILDEFIRLFAQAYRKAHDRDGLPD